MAVVDFLPRYRSKSRFDGVRNAVNGASNVRVKFDWFSINKGFRAMAHLGLCFGLTYSTFHILMGIERIQGYVAPYLG